MLSVITSTSRLLYYTHEKWDESHKFNENNYELKILLKPYIYQEIFNFLPAKKQQESTDTTKTDENKKIVPLLITYSITRERCWKIKLIFFFYFLLFTYFIHNFWILII